MLWTGTKSTTGINAYRPACDTHSGRSQAGHFKNGRRRLTAQLVVSGIGAVLTARWLLEKKENTSTVVAVITAKTDGKAGILLCYVPDYGCTPCVPLLLVIGYSFTLPLHWAAGVGFVFNLSSMATPVLLLTVITGVLSKKICREIPVWIKWFWLDRIFLIAIPFCTLW